jgi:transporter family protein
MNTKSLLIGGLLPTVLLGLGTVLMKLSMREGSSVPNYLVQVGGTVLCVGLLSTVLGGGWVSSPRAQVFAVLMGLAWASAIGSMAYAISTLGVPVSIIAPLTNSNALVALSVSALVFQEWATLDGPRVLAGALLIVLGAVVVATAKS